jgi:hypothetical protein
MPPSAEVTVPVPPPESATVNTGLTVKFAVTDLASDMLTIHVATVPLHAPDQFWNTLPGAATASSLTSVEGP